MRNKTVAALMALFLGNLGIHKFYLGKKSAGLAYLLTTLFGWLLSIIVIGLIPVFIIVIMSFVDCVSLLLMDEEEFDKAYNPKKELYRIHEFMRKYQDMFSTNVSDDNKPKKEILND